MQGAGSDRGSYRSQGPQAPHHGHSLHSGLVCCILTPYTPSLEGQKHSGLNQQGDGTAMDEMGRLRVKGTGSEARGQPLLLQAEQGWAGAAAQEEQLRSSAESLSGSWGRALGPGQS